MAPKRGGGGGGNGGGSGGSASCPADADYLCTSEMYKMYGDVYTNAEQYGQVVLYGIWCLVLIILFIRSWTLKKRGLLLKVAIVLLFLSWVFVCTRFGLIIAQSNVPIGYRFEAPVALKLWRLGMVALLASCLSPDVGKWQGIVFRFGITAYFSLGIIYGVYDFIISAKALNNFKSDWSWWISDRDFGLTLTRTQLKRLTMRNDSFYYSPSYIWSFFLSNLFAKDDYSVDRGRQIKFGVAADFVALFLAVYIAVANAMVWHKRKRQQPEYGNTNTFLVAAAVGLLLSTTFRAIVSTHFVLHNWAIITTPRQWVNWIGDMDVTTDQFGIDSYSPPSSGGDIFLKGWRTTVNGFPIVQAVIEPLGIVIACGAMVLWWRGRAKAHEREVAVAPLEYK